MAVIVDFGFAKAVIDGYEWQVKPSWFKSMLDELLDPDGPATSIPDPDFEIAKQAANKWNGRIIKHDKIERVEGREY